MIIGEGPDFSGPKRFGSTVSVGGALTVVGKILAADGVSTAPGIAFAAAPGFGWRRSGNNSISLSDGSSDYLYSAAGGFQVINTAFIGWGPGNANGTPDTYFQRLAAAAIRIPIAPPVTANYGLFNLGTAPLDGASAGFFVGSASGTHLVINAGSGFAGNLAEFQVAGVSKFKVDSAGAIKIGNTVNAVSPTAPNRTVTIDIAGTTYYLAAKTTND